MPIQYFSEDAYFVDCQFDDFDNLCSAVVAWNLDFRQIESGVFAGRLLICGMRNIQLTRAQFGRRLLQKGVPPEGMITFGLLAKPDIQIFWRGQSVSGNQLFIFPEGGELDSVTQNDFDVMLVSLSKNILERTCEQLQLPDPDILIAQKEVIDCDIRQLDKIRQYIFHQEQLLKQSETVHTTTLLGKMEVVMAKELLRLVAADKFSHNKPVLNRRAKAISRALDYIDECSPQNGNLLDLSKYAQVSQRTLEYAFKERFQMTPKAFMQASLLNKTKRALLNADPDDAKVYKIAEQAGFWHMSQFAADYRKLFGELPSQTLTREMVNP